MKAVEVVVSREGAITIEAVGFTGADCEQATRFLEEALGTQGNRQRKPEYFVQRPAKQRLHQKGGS